MRGRRHGSMRKNLVDIARRASPKTPRAAPKRGRQSDARREWVQRRRAPDRWHRHARFHSSRDADALRTRPPCDQQVAGPVRAEIFVVVLFWEEKNSIGDSRLFPAE